MYAFDDTVTPLALCKEKSFDCTKITAWLQGMSIIYLTLYKTAEMKWPSLSGPKRRELYLDQREEKSSGLNTMVKLI